MSEQPRRLVRLAQRYPGTSRMTRWRIRNQPDFPTPVVVRNREYFVETELDDFEERRRRRKGTQATADTTA